MGHRAKDCRKGKGKGDVNGVSENSSEDKNQQDQAGLGVLDLGGGNELMHVELAPPSGINHVSEEWGKVTRTADSGAVGIVGPGSGGVSAHKGE